MTTSRPHDRLRPATGFHGQRWIRSVPIAHLRCGVGRRAGVDTAGKDLSKIQKVVGTIDRNSRVRLADEVVQELRNRIYEGRYPPGARLRQ
jgi:hypothetical protein